MSTKDKPSRNNKNKHQQKKPPKKPEKATTPRWAWVALAIVVVTTLIIYFNAIKFRFLFNWDDDTYIIDNADIRNLGFANIKLFFSKFYVGNYQPLLLLFYAIEYKLFGLNASYYHFVNILIHIINTCLVFLLVKKISPKNIMVALITAGFFAIHPMHVESVAWVAETKDVLYTLFFLVSLIFYLKYLDTGTSKHLLVTGVFFVLSCLSKSAGVILPLVMLLLDYYTGRKRTLKMFVEKAPFFVVSVILGVVAIYSQKAAIHEMPPNMSAIESIAVVSFSFLRYILKAFVPANLAVVYPFPPELGGTLPVKYYLYIVFVTLILFFTWYSRKWGKDVIFGVLFFIITIILVLQFLPVGAASMADRYSYVPYIGIFFMIGKLYEYLSENEKLSLRKSSNYLLALLLAGYLAFSAVTFSRVKKWQDIETLFTDGIEKCPDSYLSYYIRGAYFLKYHALTINSDNEEKKQLYASKSIPDFNKAIEYHKNYPDAYSNRGYAKSLNKDYNGAIKDFDQAISFDKNHINAHLNRGYTRREIKDFNGAIQDFSDVIRISPANAMAYCDRGTTKYLMQDYPGALEDFNKAIEIDDKYIKAINNRGSTKFMMKDFNGALDDYNKTLQIDPGNQEAINNRNVVMGMVSSKQ